MKSVQNLKKKLRKSIKNQTETENNNHFINKKTK